MQFGVEIVTLVWSICVTYNDKIQTVCRYRERFEYLIYIFTYSNIPFVILQIAQMSYWIPF